MKTFTAKEIERLHQLLPSLSESQIRFVMDIIGMLSEPFDYKNINNEWVFNEEFIDIFADFVRIHHALSNEPFTKDKFEYALNRACKILGIPSILPGRTNPGHDINIDNIKVSLKTQADLGINIKYIHISKFMELGKGKWEDETDLIKFRDNFLSHMNDYEKIITLRCLSTKEERIEGHWKYEMVEIPKDLLKKAAKGKIEIMTKSKQTPKPGYCYVYENNKELFELYFDGGSERKLQIKKLMKENCIVLASFAFKK